MTITPGQLVDPAAPDLHIRLYTERHVVPYLERHIRLYTDTAKAVDDPKQDPSVIVRVLATRRVASTAPPATRRSLALRS